MQSHNFELVIMQSQTVERDMSARDGRVAWFAGQEEAGHSECVVPPYELKNKRS